LDAFAGEPEQHPSSHPFADDNIHAASGFPIVDLIDAPEKLAPFGHHTQGMKVSDGG
jgi:hypothetical protein